VLDVVAFTGFPYLSIRYRIVVDSGCTKVLVGIPVPVIKYPPRIVDALADNTNLFEDADVVPDRVVTAVVVYDNCLHETKDGGEMPEPSVYIDPPVGGMNVHAS
jgi:hypothetical protein